MKSQNLLLPAAASLVIFSGVSARADDMASISVNAATGEVTLTPRWDIGGNLGGFYHFADAFPLGGGVNQFYSIKNSLIPLAGDISAFTSYEPAAGAATDLTDIGSKLRPNTYSALTSAAPDLGYGSNTFYFIHKKDDGDYFATLVPGSGTSSSIEDRKPMSQPGGPGTGGDSGYFGLTFSADDLGFGANLFYYMRTDPTTGFGILGSLEPSLLLGPTDRNNLGIAGYEAFAYTTTEVGYGTNKFYYHRRDPVTGFTILGTANITTGRGEDIANLGSVFSTLTFVPGDVGFGTNLFYTTGLFNPTWQSVSFRAIPDRELSDGPFTVTPTASSSLPIQLTVVAGSTATATIVGPAAGVFTVTPTSEGRLILQATQMGQSGPPEFEFNMLRQGFNVGDGPYLPPGVFPPGTVPPGTDVPPGGGSGGGNTVPAPALLADFNRDGFSDIVLRKRRSGTVSVVLMRGATVVAKRVIARKVPRELEIAAVGDFTGDGHSDLLLRNAETNRLSLWVMRGTRIRNDREIKSRLAKSKNIVAAGDFNGDGRADVLWRKDSGGVGVLLARGGKRFNSRFIGWNAPSEVLAAAGDFTKDGQVDIVFRNSDTSAMTLWEMNQTNVRSTSPLTSTFNGWKIETTGDFNGDGQIDILLRRNRTIEAGLMDGDEMIGSSLILSRPRAVKIQN